MYPITHCSRLDWSHAYKWLRPYPIIQEYATGFDAGLLESTLEHPGSNIVNHCPTVVDGFVDMPQGPGLGVNLLENAQTVSFALLQPIKMRLYKDGFVVDQQSENSPYRQKRSPYRQERNMKGGNK